jgi:3-phenylpropionate/cinnamic acid dioxygenase small subunit
MKISPAKADQKQMRAYMNELHSQCPGAVSHSENVIDLDGMGDAWLGLMEEDTLFNMQDWEVEDRAGSHKRRKTR